MPVITSTKKVIARFSRPRAVLDQVDRGEQADRHRDHRGERRDDQRADDGVVGAAALADDAAHRGGEELAVEPGQAPC
jgi:hypothetical protein